MHKVNSWVWRLFTVLLMSVAGIGSALAQAGTNMVVNLGKNIEHAESVLVPLGIGLTILFIAIAVGVKIYRKTLK